MHGTNIEIINPSAWGEAMSGIKMGEHEVIDVPQNDCNITTVEAEFDRGMAYKPKCFGKERPILSTKSKCGRCNWVKECAIEERVKAAKAEAPQEEREIHIAILKGIANEFVAVRRKAQSERISSDCYYKQVFRMMCVNIEQRKNRLLELNEVIL